MKLFFLLNLLTIISGVYCITCIKNGDQCNNFLNCCEYLTSICKKK